MDHLILFEKMKHHKISTDIINTVKFIYSNIYTQVDVSTPPIPINKGVLQGGILSPILFNIYINDLIIELKQKGATDICA